MCIKIALGEPKTKLWGQVHFSWRTEEEESTQETEKGQPQVRGKPEN